MRQFQNNITILFLFLASVCYGQLTVNQPVLFTRLQGGNFFVSTSGSGTGTGQKDDPFTGDQFETLLESSQIPYGSNIYFKRGDTFDNQFDVGTSGLRFADYGSGALPIIDPSVDLSGASWTNHSGNIYYTTLDDTYDTDLKWVWYNNKSAKIAETAWIPIVSRPSSTSLTALATTLDALDGVESIIGSGIICKEWSFRPCYRRTVTNYVTGSPNGTITMNAAPNTDASGAAAGMPFKLLNKVSYITEAGEWAFDTSTNRLYIQTTGGSPGNVKITLLQYGIKLSSGVNNITVQNIRFQHQYLEGFYSANNDNIRVTGCQFYDIRTNGVSFIGNGDDISFTYNDLQRIDNNAVHVGGITKGLFTNNTIDSIGMGPIGFPHYTYFRSIACGFHLRWDSTATVFVPKDIIITDNDITNMGYAPAVIVGKPSNYTYNEFKRNICDTYNRRWADGGGIYVSNVYGPIYGGGSDTRDWVIEDNMVINGLGGSLTLDGITGGNRSIFGIYMDNNCHKIQVLSNYIENVQLYGIFTNAGTEENTIKYNTVVAATSAGMAFDNGSGTYPNGEKHVLVGNYFVQRNSTSIGIYIRPGTAYDPFASGGSCDSNRYVAQYRTQVVTTADGSDRTLSSWQSFSSHDAHATELTNNLREDDATKAAIDVLSGTNSTGSPTTLTPSTDTWMLDPTGSHVTSTPIPARFGAVLVRDWAPDGTLIIDDTYTGSAGNLTGHTPDVGSAWLIESGAFALDGSGRVGASSAGTFKQDASTTTATVETTGQNTSTGGINICLRTSNSTTRLLCRILLNSPASTSQTQLIVDGVTIKGLTSTKNTSTDYTIKAKVSGGTVGIWVNGALQVDVVSNATVAAESVSTTTHGVNLPTTSTHTRTRIWNQ